MIFIRLCLIFIIILLIVFIHVQICQNNDKKYICPFTYDELFMGNETSESDIPNIIWTYWDTCPPAMIMAFIKTWIDNNPNHKVVILTNENYTQFIDPINVKYDHIIKTEQQKSDYIRLNVLYKYGGIWMDASILCTQSISWIHTIQKHTGVEYVGYNLNREDEVVDVPIVENWFFACIPKCKFLYDVLKELDFLTTFDSVNDYKFHILAKGVNLNDMNQSMLNYLWVHIIIQSVLQNNSNGKYHMHLINAASTAFLYLTRNDWNSNIGIQDLIDGKFKQPIIKLRGPERNILTNFPELANKLFQQFGVNDYLNITNKYNCSEILTGNVLEV